MGVQSQQSLFMSTTAGGGGGPAMTLDLSAYTASQSGVGSGPFTTGNVTATPTNGTPAYTYSWVRQSGDATISVSSSTAQSPNWSASGTPVQTKNAVWRCTVTDSLSATAIPPSDLSVSITFNSSTLSATLDYSAISADGYTGGSYLLSTSAVTCTPSGGTGPYTYEWIRNTGTVLTLSRPTEADTIFSYYWAPVDSFTADYFCRVTDSLSQQADSGLVTVTLNFN